MNSEKPLTERLGREGLDSILNTLLRSKHKVHRQEFKDTIGWIHDQWVSATSEHSRKVLRGAYKKFCDTYCHTFGEIYHNSLHKDIRNDIRDAQVIGRYKK